MLLRGLSSNINLDVAHFETLDQFRSLERLGNARSIPLGSGCDSARALLRLPSCELVVQRSFPRIMDVSYEIDGLLCFVPLSDEVDATVNGVRLHGQSIMVLRDGATCQIVEPCHNLYAILRIDGSVADCRGWRQPTDRKPLIGAVSAEVLAPLRLSVYRLLNFASSSDQVRFDPATVVAMEDDLLLSLDDVMAPLGVVRSPAHFQQYLKIVRRMEDFVNQSPSVGIHADALARACNVSVRTLHTATRAVRGIGPARYLRLRRLWAVRKTLSQGRAIIKISDVARANGFWHMGEFSVAYRSVFGETPTQTVSRSGSAK